MKFLDSTGLGVLWNKIKGSFLPLSGGTMTGTLTMTETLNCKTPNNTILYSLSSNGDVAHNHGTGWIHCKNADSGHAAILSGGQVNIYGDKHLQITGDDITIDDVSIIDEAITTEELNEVLV